jgi:Arc/MetJ-type ribon-helix-helix transcriptional regulator
MTTVQVAVRLAQEQVDRIDELVGGLHESRSDVVRRALDFYLYRLAAERDASRYEAEPLSDRELAFADDPETWKATPAW